MSFRRLLCFFRGHDLAPAGDHRWICQRCDGEFGLPEINVKTPAPPCKPPAPPPLPPFGPPSSDAIPLPPWCRTLVVDGARFSVEFLRELAKSPPAAEALWKLLRISREAGADEVQVTVSRSLFLVGRNTDPFPWEVMGLYTSKEAAVAKCREPSDFVMELRLDEDLPEAREIPPADRCWYPLMEATP